MRTLNEELLRKRLTRYEYSMCLRLKKEKEIYWKDIHRIGTQALNRLVRRGIAKKAESGKVWDVHHELSWKLVVGVGCGIQNKRHYYSNKF